MFGYFKLKSQVENLQNSVIKMHETCKETMDFCQKVISSFNDLEKLIRDSKDYENLEKRIAALELEHDKLRIDFESTQPKTEEKYGEDERSG